MQSQPHQMDFDPYPAPKPKDYSAWFAVIALLLLLLLTINATSFVLTYQKNELEAQRATNYQERVEVIRVAMEEDRTRLADLLTEYEKEVYQNPALTRIAEQQLKAEEFQLIALLIIARQNSELFELTAYQP